MQGFSPSHKIPIRWLTGGDGGVSLREGTADRSADVDEGRGAREADGRVCSAESNVSPSHRTTLMCVKYSTTTTKHHDQQSSEGLLL
ncbi:unnamed protein product [Arctogadus glacialis]